MFFKKEKSNYQLGIVLSVTVLLGMFLPIIQGMPCVYLLIDAINELSSFGWMSGAEIIFYIGIAVLSISIVAVGAVILIRSIGGLKSGEATSSVARNGYNVLLFTPTALWTLLFLMCAFLFQSAASFNALFYILYTVIVLLAAFSFLPASEPTVKKLVLASASPRREELIKKLLPNIKGLVITVVPPSVEESVRLGESPEAYAMRTARDKAEEVSARADADAIVLGCDTVVALDGQVFGKPRDASGAIEMFRALCGRAHEVITGIFLMRTGKNPKFIGTFEKTHVTFGAFDEKIVYNYVESGAYADKAGGYGLQDGAIKPLITKVEGDPDNVIGLPVKLVARVLRENF